MLVRQATEAGVFEESEQDMFEAVLRFGDKSARSLMTPRTRITWLDLEFTHEQIREKIISSGHSCFPVGSGGLDMVAGVVHAKDLLAHSLAGNALDLQRVVPPAPICAAHGDGAGSFGVVQRNPANISRSWSTSTAASRGC